MECKYCGSTNVYEGFTGFSCNDKTCLGYDEITEYEVEHDEEE